MSLALCCFGGPLDGETVERLDGSPWYAIVPMEINWLIDQDLMAKPYEELRYNLERFSWGPRSTIYPALLVSFYGWCWVAEDYDKQQIADTLNALAGLISALHGRDAVKMGLDHPPITMEYEGVWV